MPLLLPLLLMQANVDAAGIASPYASQLPKEIVEKKMEEERKRRAEQAAQAAGPAIPESNTGCMLAVESDPAGSAEIARKAMAEAQGRARVRAGLCLGAALSQLDRWGEARTAFVQARDAADLEDHPSRARLGAMAGSAALADGKPGDALSLLAPAAADARQTEDKELLASIALDRARALVALSQPDEAGNALAEARAADPANAQAWLLSATLSRRQNKLIEAQTQIEQAATLAPQDPEVGLEAGVIAVLAGRNEAARRSWNSVVATSPDSLQAATARGYLTQLGSDAKAPPAKAR